MCFNTGFHTVSGRVFARGIFFEITQLNPIPKGVLSWRRSIGGRAVLAVSSRTEKVCFSRTTIINHCLFSDKIVRENRFGLSEKTICGQFFKRFMEHFLYRNHIFPIFHFRQNNCPRTMSENLKKKNWSKQIYQSLSEKKALYSIACRVDHRTSNLNCVVRHQRMASSPSTRSAWTYLLSYVLIVRAPTLSAVI